MALGKDRAVLKSLRTLFNVGAIGDLTDGQLLERFAASRGEAAELAFAVLVERHGSMVLRVCRGVLVDPSDTEDAFQATFLVLVKKARGLWVRDSLGPWLHQVAYRTALRARSGAARRRRHERRAAIARPEGRAEPEDELIRVLHEELARLPERFRAPLVLCDLEGRSHEQAARHLGWPVGTVKSRQARGRERLRERLQRRGFAPNAEAIVAALLGHDQNAVLSPVLLDATTKAVVHYGTVSKLIPGPAASLAHGVLRSMVINQWLKVASIVFAVGATISGAGVVAQRGQPGDPPPAKGELHGARAYGGPVHEVKPGKLIVNDVSQGFVESARNQDLFCMVEGTNSIISLKPEGTSVKKGEVVCELDSAALKDQVLNQQIGIGSAEASVVNAKLAREAAEVAANENIERIYKHELEALGGEINRTRVAIEKSESQLRRLHRTQQQLVRNRAQAKVHPSSADIVAELDIQARIEATERAMKHDKTALELAATKQSLLAPQARRKATTGLDDNVARKRLDELAKQAILEVEQQTLAKLYQQIAYCVIKAPADGIIVYANDYDSVVGRIPKMEEGAQVRERQKILSVADMSKMRVNAKVREPRIDQIKPGMKARIRVKGVDSIMEGRVTEVSPLPDGDSFGHSSFPKVYTTKVEIGRPLPVLRPGMYATVDILIDERDNVLTVPVQAVASYLGKDQVAVRNPEGTFEWRDVTLGLSSDTLVEVKDGIRSGEQVALDPLSLLTEAERARLKSTTEPVTKPAKKQGDSR